MKNLIKVLVVIFAVAFVIKFCRANFSDMTANETYVSTNDKNIRIELTEEKKKEIHDNSAYEGVEPTIEEVGNIAYLYVNDEVYEGTYHMFVSNKLNKELSIDFDDNGLYHRVNPDNPGSWLIENFYVKRNKLEVKDKNAYLTSRSIFKENNTFIKKTWWSTWGKKLCIILIAVFIVWLLRIPEFIMNRKYREESINEFKESKKEYDKAQAELKMDYDKEVSECRETMNEGINEFKKTMQGAKEGVTEIKNILKKGLEEYKKDNKKG